MAKEIFHDINCRRNVHLYGRMRIELDAIWQW
jgi:hypothetical protein